jgi:hypothetical protein
MREKHQDQADHGAVVFADPVAYLAELGINAEVIAETTLPAAA